MIPMVRVVKYLHTPEGIQTRHIDLALTRSAVAARILKAVNERRESYHPRMLAALDAGKLSVDVITGLFSPDEIRAAVERRTKALAEEVRALDKLVPRAKQSMFISGDEKVVDDANEIGDWDDLADYDAREQGGDGRTKVAQRSTERVRKSIDALKAAAEELNRAGGR